MTRAILILLLTPAACSAPQVAPQPPLSPCALWAGELQALSGEGVTVPSEAKVLRACALMPEEVRHCLPPSGWLAQPQICRETLASLPAPLKKEIRLLLGDSVQKRQRLDAPPPQR